MSLFVAYYATQPIATACRCCCCSLYNKLLHSDLYEVLFAYGLVLDCAGMWCFRLFSDHLNTVTMFSLFPLWSNGVVSMLPAESKVWSSVNNYIYCWHVCCCINNCFTWSLTFIWTLWSKLLLIVGAECLTAYEICVGFRIVLVSSLNVCVQGDAINLLLDYLYGLQYYSVRISICKISWLLLSFFYFWYLPAPHVVASFTAILYTFPNLVLSLSPMLFNQYCCITNY